ncbi:hypothetical protein RHMOL_Rhmol08G0308600 [Rhododendron molle]|uniref:Uncharacterized protein n=1 Tax=Rhododendron molle TaxID=49168 RepID=A0ACC0MUK7_RHOML|nr:hypothetical protein RHMOL_Rhmol08G0308600 [Rhododendron molle]
MLQIFNGLKTIPDNDMQGVDMESCSENSVTLINGGQPQNSLHRIITEECTNMLKSFCGTKKQWLWEVEVEVEAEAEKEKVVVVEKVMAYSYQGKIAELRLVLVAVASVITGYFIGSSFHKVSSNKIQMPTLNYNVEDVKQIYVQTNPRGAESLPPDIVEPYSDFHPHRQQENSTEDLVGKPKYLLALTVGYDQQDIINEIVMKFPENFSIVLFHYDGRTSEWDQFEWSHRAIHISARKQAKWWYAKRFLHPDIVSAYEYIFIWDEDLGVDHFNAEEYLKLVKKHDLEISQPGIEQKTEHAWLMTKRRVGIEVHKKTKERQGKCQDKNQPPCARFVEIMAPVFSRKSWQCVWHMIQNDLIHGWGLDFHLWRCVERPYEKIGVVDAQWVEHKNLPSLGNQVLARCSAEYGEFERRMYMAEHGNGSQTRGGQEEAVSVAIGGGKWHMPPPGPNIVEEKRQFYAKRILERRRFFRPLGPIQ